MNAPYLGVRPKYAEIWSLESERLCEIILPKGTRLPLAERAIGKAVSKWIEQLDKKLNLALVSNVRVEGPYLCPFVDKFGEDLWLARARFTSRKPRLVREDVVVANRRLAEDVGISYEEMRKDKPQPMADIRRQLNFVAANADRIYDDLRRIERMRGTKEGTLPSRRKHG